MGKVMNIGFFNGYEIWGGGEKWHYEMSSYCNERKDNVVIFTPQDGELAQRFKKLNFKIIDIKIRKSSYYNPFFFLSTWIKIKNEDLDVLVFNSYRDVRSAALAGSMAGVKKILLRCGMPIAPKESLSYKLSFKYGLDYFVPISSAIKEEFSLKAPSLLDQSQYVPCIANGIDLNEFKYRENLLKKDEVPILGNASRLSSQKGFNLLFSALKILKDEKIKFKMKIAGEGNLKQELEMLSIKLGLENEIEFLGHIDNVSSFLNEVHIYPFPSLFEGTSRSLLEAMAVGRPVIAFDTSSMKEIISHNETGFLVTPFDEMEFSSRIKELIQNIKLQKKFAASAYKKVIKCFDKKNNFLEWYSFLSK